MVTAHTAAATSATIVRGVEGTSARQHLQGTTWRHVATYYDDLQIVASAAALPSTNIYQGQMAYQQDLDKYVGRSSSGVWQDLVPMGAWTAYTPTLTQSATVTKTVTYARYTRIGRTISVQLDIGVTGTGVANNEIILGLPVTAATGCIIYGVGMVYDQSANASYTGVSELNTTTSIRLRGTTTTGNLFLGGAGAAFTAALVSGDIIRFGVTYEAAS